jgi:hypothetical protein
MVRIALSLVVAATLLFAAPPAAIVDMLRSATEALANRDAKAFLDRFDRNTPGYANIAQQVSALVAVDGAASTIEILRDKGDQRERHLEIDWVMRVGPSRRKHGTVTMTVTEQNGKWKITRFVPADFFTAP